MFLHYMARYLCMYNESIYERTNIYTYESYKPLNMRNYMELLDELLILNVYGSEDDSEEESEDELQLHETSELHNISRKIPILQHEDDSTPKGRRCSRRPRNQRVEKAITATTVKKNNKNTKRTNTTKKVKVNSLLTNQSETNMSTSDHKEFRTKKEDPYLLWLTAVMLKRIDRYDEAIDLLVRALRLQPCHWGAWLELSTLITDIKMVIVKKKTINISYNILKLLLAIHFLCFPLLFNI